MTAGSIVIYRGEIATIRFTLTTGENITGWSLMFTAAKALNMKTKVFGPVACVIDNGLAGQFHTTLSAAVTSAIKPFVGYYDVWRTNAGFEEVLGLGSFEISADARVPTS